MKGSTEYRDALLRYALAFPGAYEDHPWGESVAKIGKKVFVFLGVDREATFGMSVKLPRSGGKVLMAPFATPTGYGLGKSGWVSLRFEPGDEPPPLAMMFGWIEESFRAVANKTQIAALEAAPPDATGGTRATKAGAETTAGKISKKTTEAKASKTAPAKKTSKKAASKKAASKKTSKKRPSKKTSKRATAKKAASKKAPAK